MKKFLVLATLTVCAMLMAAVPAFSNPIAESLGNHGIVAEKMSDQAMFEAKGTQMPVTWAIEAAPWHWGTYTLPYASKSGSVDRHGLAEHRVKFKNTGHQTDYRSYQYVGRVTAPGEYGRVQVNLDDGSKDYWMVTGDVWHADMDYKTSTWGYTTPDMMMFVETHVIAVDPNTGEQYMAPGSTTQGYGFNFSGWNRPLGTFSW